MDQYFAPWHSENQSLEYEPICNINSTGHITNLDTLFLELLMKQWFPLNYLKILNMFKHLPLSY